jgi:Uma2 family endonuclease
MTEEQYLAIERAAEFRSEFLDGEMFAMAGASMRHVRIQQNLAGELHASLRGSRCEALGSDCRIKWLSLYLRREQSVPSGITID